MASFKTQRFYHFTPKKKNQSFSKYFYVLVKYPVFFWQDEYLSSDNFASYLIDCGSD